MKFRTLLIAIGFSGLSLLANVSNAATLVSQAPDGGGIFSEEVTDRPDLSAFAFDDFTLTQAQALSSLFVFGLESGDRTQNLAVTAEIYSNLPGSFGGTLVKSFSGTEDEFGNLSFSLGGFQLGAGTYWLTAFVTRPTAGEGEQFSFGTSMPVNDTEAYFYNPGGGFNVGTDPIPLGVDLAFILSGDAVRTGVVPEPGSLALFGAALAAAGMVRRRRTL